MRTPFLVIIITYTISIIGLLLIDGIDSEGRPYHLSIFDAFYFISYTATTIGFGETPFTFTYPQRIWVSITVFFYRYRMVLQYRDFSGALTRQTFFGRACPRQI